MQIKYVWKTKYTFANVLFVCARYSAFLTAILVLLPVRSPQISPNPVPESHPQKNPSPQ